MKWIVAGYLTYAAGGFLTAAYYDQHVYTPCWAQKNADPLRPYVGFDCGATPIVAMVWPGYWAWRGALAVTR